MYEVAIPIPLKGIAKKIFRFDCRRLIASILNVEYFLLKSLSFIALLIVIATLANLIVNLCAILLAIDCQHTLKVA